MIKSSDIRQAIARLIKVDAALPLKVYFDRVPDKPKNDYAWVKLRPARHDEGFGMFVRNIRADIMVSLLPGKNTEISHEKLYDIVDALDEATCGYILIKDRSVVDDNKNVICDVTNHRGGNFYGLTDAVTKSQVFIKLDDKDQKKYVVDKNDVKIGEVVGETNAVSGYLLVKDRHITICETSANIFDNILTYSLVLDFADYCDKFCKGETEAQEYMQQLFYKINDNEYSSL